MIDSLLTDRDTSVPPMTTQIGSLRPTTEDTAVAVDYSISESTSEAEPQPVQQNISAEVETPAPTAPIPPDCLDIDGTVYSMITLIELFREKLDNMDADLRAKVEEVIDVHAIATSLRHSDTFTNALASNLRQNLDQNELRLLITNQISSSMTFRTQVMIQVAERLSDSVNTETERRLNSSITRIKQEVGQEYTERLAEMEAGRTALREGIGNFLLGDSIQQEVNRLVRAQVQEIEAENQALLQEIRTQQANLSATYGAMMASEHLRISQIDVSLPYPLFPPLAQWAEDGIRMLEESNADAPRRVTKRTRPYAVGLLVSPELPEVESRPAGNKLYVTGHAGELLPLRELISLLPGDRELSIVAICASNVLSNLVARHPKTTYCTRNLFAFYYPDLTPGQRGQLVDEATPMCQAGATNYDMLKAFHFHYQRHILQPAPPTIEAELENTLSRGQRVHEQQERDIATTPPEGYED